MTNVAGWNIGALAVTMVLASGAVWMPALRHGGTSAADSPPPVAGEAPLADHSGTSLPRASYTKIASFSSVSDRVLIEICEPDRIVAFTDYSAESSTTSYRFHGKPTLASGELEPLLALHPDLVFVSTFGDPRPVQRMRDAGLIVFDLGEMRGLVTLIPNIREIASAIGHPERGERFARSLLSEMGAVAADIPAPSRRRGMYLSIYGARLFGGSVGTTYHDVLVSAGLVDAAASYGDWPQYSTEQVLALDPDIIVTNGGMRERICEHMGLRSLRACGSPERIVEVENELLADPGPAMLDAAEAVRDGVYGPPGSVVGMKR
jgi:iron complex transport system substrate-binding protein